MCAYDGAARSEVDVRVRSACCVLRTPDRGRVPHVGACVFPRMYMLPLGNRAAGEVPGGYAVVCTGLRDAVAQKGRLVNREPAEV